MITGTGRIRLRSIVVLIGIAVAIDGSAPPSRGADPQSPANALQPAAAAATEADSNAVVTATAKESASEKIADTNAVAAATAANQAEVLQTTRQMLDSLQRQIESQVARHTEAITSALSQIEPALDRIRLQQEQSASNANRTFLVAAGLFAVAGFLGLGFLTMASMRAMGRFTDVAMVASNRKQLPGTEPGPAGIPATADSFKPAVSGTVEQASARFQGAIEQLERRIRELEHTSHPPAGALPQRTPAAAAFVAITPAAPTNNGTETASLTAAPEPAKPGDDPNNIHALAAQAAAAAAGLPRETADSSKAPGTESSLAKGQALLDADQAVEALKCFENTLAEDPDNTDALLRKGMALEKLQEWERALACYDRVLDLDETLTVAHLYRGGVCNRLERHREALESYEKALRSERQRTPAPATQTVMP